MRVDQFKGWFDGFVQDRTHLGLKEIEAIKLKVSEIEEPTPVYYPFYDPFKIPPAPQRWWDVIYCTKTTDNSRA
jgi:hypothetical protein